jgi:hypothetical protein
MITTFPAIPYAPLDSPALTGSVSAVHLDVTGNALGEATPDNHNLVAWAYDSPSGTTASTAVNGTVYLVKMMVNQACTITKIYWHVGTIGATPTSTQNNVGLYSSAGTRLATTNVDTSISSLGMKTTTITGQALTAGSFVWVGMVFNATTPPSLARCTAIGQFDQLVNVGLTAATYRFAVAGTAQTSLPVSITPASNAIPTFSYWAAIGV